MNFVGNIDFFNKFYFIDKIYCRENIKTIDNMNLVICIFYKFVID